MGESINFLDSRCIIFPMSQFHLIYLIESLIIDSAIDNSTKKMIIQLLQWLGCIEIINFHQNFLASVFLNNNF